MLPFRAGKFFRDFPDFLHRPSGVREQRQRVRPDGAAPFLHRKAGVRELPQAGSPLTGRLLFCTGKPGRANCVSVFALTGGKFFAEPQQGDSPSADGGDVPRPAAGAKRKGHLRFPFLFELLPFPCFLIRRRFPICDRFEKGNGRGFFLPCFSQPVRRVR